MRFYYINNLKLFEGKKLTFNTVSRSYKELEMILHKRKSTL